MNDIPGFNTYKKIKRIDYGLSANKKYFIETHDGQRLFLRISEISEYNKKRTEYERMKRMFENGIPMPYPVDFGICEDGRSVYHVMTWCDGDLLENVLPSLTETEQYAMGMKAGKILKRIHSVPVAEADVTAASWNERYSLFIDESIHDYHTTGVKAENAERMLDYFNENRYLLNVCTQCYLHGDFSTGNNIVTLEHDLTVVDWEMTLFNNYGNPWYEGMIETPHFGTGMVHGYFGGDPPEDYWRILALYNSISPLSSIPGRIIIIRNFWMRQLINVLIFYNGTEIIFRISYQHGI